MSSGAFFKLLEQRFGRFADLHETASVCRVLTSERKLDPSHLKDLLQHKCVAIHVKEFCSDATSESLANMLLKRDSISKGDMSWKVATGRGMESSDVRAVAGVPFNMARKDKSHLQQYFSETRNEIDWLRKAAPDICPLKDVELLSPLDKLRLDLDECHPKGATLLKDTETGNPYLPGIGRIMEGPTKWVDGFAHVDELGPLSESQGLFSANIYLHLPPSGGELHIWGVSFKNRWDFYRHASTLSCLTTPNEDAQRKLRACLPKPIRIRPQPGDLVMICTQRPHAVQGFPVGNRVSLQSFITHSSNGPLVIDN